MTYAVSMKDYEGFGGFQGGFAPFQMTPEQVGEFRKALSANYQAPRMDGSAALRVESLEATLRVLTFRAEHAKLWKDIPKMPAYSTVHEYNVQYAYGADAGAFVGAGEAPQVQDSAYARKSAYLKFMATQREVDHPSMMVKPAHGPLIAMQTKDAATWLIERAERALFFGRADVIPHEFDGYDQLLRQDTVYGVSNIIDMRGAPLTQDKVEEGANVIDEAYGLASDMYLAPRALSDLGKQMIAKERIVLPAANNGRVSSRVNLIETQSADVNLKKNIFLRSGRNNGKKTAPASATALRAPTAPTSIAGTPGATTGSLFAAADAGTYQYKATAINRFGESAPTQESGGVAIVAGDGASLVITDAGGEASTGYNIYRSDVGAAAGTEQLILRAPRGGATTTIVDINRFLPGMSRAYMFQMNMEALSVVQLAPMFKIPFATQALSVRWAQAMYLAAVLYAPGKIVIYDNVLDD